MAQLVTRSRWTSAHRRRHPLRSRGWAGLAVLLALAPPAIASDPPTPGRRTVAIGDLHGNVPALHAILRETGLADEALRWTGGDATLIQLGDIVDRAPRLREILDLLMRLEGEAERVGGRVVVVLGNHEINDLLGVLREVDDRTYATFADSASEARRQEAFAEYARFLRTQADALGVPRPQLTEELERQWFAAHPPGKVEFLEAFRPEGVYGRYLRDRPAVVRVGDTAFVHGALGPALRGRSIEEINRTVHEEIATFDHIRDAMVDLGLVQPTSSIHLMDALARQELALTTKTAPSSTVRLRQRAARAEIMRPLGGWQKWLIADPAGPLWNAAPSFSDEQEDVVELVEMLAGFGIRRMVVGHAPRKDGRILSRFDGRVFVIDTLMEKWPERGAPSALEVRDGVFTAVYPGEREVLLVATDVARPEPAP